MEKKIEKIKAASIILIYRGKALLMLRDDIPNILYPGMWGVAGGGHVEEDETFLEAAMRELREETGYISKEPIPLMSTTSELPDGRTVETKRFYEVYDGIQELVCNEGQKHEFLTPAKIKEVNTIPGLDEAALKAIELAGKDNVD